MYQNSTTTSIGQFETRLAKAQVSLKENAALIGRSNARMAPRFDTLKSHVVSIYHSYQKYAWELSYLVKPSLALNQAVIANAKSKIKLTGYEESIRGAKSEERVARGELTFESFPLKALVKLSFGLLLVFLCGATDWLLTANALQVIGLTLGTALLASACIIGAYGSFAHLYKRWLETARTRFMRIAVKTAASCILIIIPAMLIYLRLRYTGQTDLLTAIAISALLAIVFISMFLTVAYLIIPSIREIMHGITAIRLSRKAHKASKTAKQLLADKEILIEAQADTIEELVIASDFYNRMKALITLYYIEAVDAYIQGFSEACSGQLPFCFDELPPALDFEEFVVTIREPQL